MANGLSMLRAACRFNPENPLDPQAENGWLIGLSYEIVDHSLLPRL